MKRNLIAAIASLMLVLLLSSCGFMNPMDPDAGNSASQPKMYSITLKSPGEDDEVVYVKANESYRIPQRTREGSTLIAVKTDTASYKPGDVITVNSDIVLTYVWDNIDPIEKGIKFNAVFPDGEYFITDLADTAPSRYVFAVAKDAYNSKYQINTSSQPNAKFSDLEDGEYKVLALAQNVDGYLISSASAKFDIIDGCGITRTLKFGSNGNQNSNIYLNVVDIPEGTVRLQILDKSNTGLTSTSDYDLEQQNGYSYFKVGDGSKRDITYSLASGTHTLTLKALGREGRQLGIIQIGKVMVMSPFGTYLDVDFSDSSVKGNIFDPDKLAPECTLPVPKVSGIQMFRFDMPAELQAPADFDKTVSEVSLTYKEYDYDSGKVVGKAAVGDTFTMSLAGLYVRDNSLVHVIALNKDGETVAQSDIHLNWPLEVSCASTLPIGMVDLRSNMRGYLGVDWNFKTGERSFEYFRYRFKDVVGNMNTTIINRAGKIVGESDTTGTVDSNGTVRHQIHHRTGIYDVTVELLDINGDVVSEVDLGKVLIASNLCTDIQKEIDASEFSLPAVKFTSKEKLIGVGAYDVTLAHESNGVQIRYTLDGSIPEMTDNLYDWDKGFIIPDPGTTEEQTTVVKARAFMDGRKPSPVTSWTFKRRTADFDRYEWKELSAQEAMNMLEMDENGVLSFIAGVDLPDAVMVPAKFRGEPVKKFAFTSGASAIRVGFASDSTIESFNFNNSIGVYDIVFPASTKRVESGWSFSGNVTSMTFLSADTLDLDLYCGTGDLKDVYIYASDSVTLSLDSKVTIHVKQKDLHLYETSYYKDWVVPDIPE